MFKRFLRDKKGLTLIELICAVGILSVIAATVGGAMVITTNSYRQGTVESSLQQESQFTVSAIEALIVDATDEVDFTGGVLTIKNTDYTYVITFDSGAHTLRYTQYSTTNPSDVVASNDLLAEHVEDFFADTTFFSSNRTVRLALKMKNEKSEFTTTYNITSRNNPNAGTPVTVTASILCQDSVTLEPNETYNLPVSVVGPTNTNFNCYLEPEPDGTIFASAVPNGSGIDIAIGDAEDGGADGLLRLWINTSAVDGSGNPLKTKLVLVNIRRVNSMAIQENSVTGTRAMENSEYIISVPDAEFVGTNLDKVVAAPYDLNYVNPRTLVWSFEASSGDWHDYFDVTSDVSALRQSTLQFKLKKDVPPGESVTVKATNLHSLGTDAVLGTTTNKTGLPYDAPVYAIYEIKVDENSDIARGAENYLPLPPGMSPGDMVPDYDGGFQSQFLFRYISTDDPSHTSQDYPQWKKMQEGGLQNGGDAEFKINRNDLNDMYYMENYTMQICYSFKYKPTVQPPWEKYFPEGSEDPTSFHLNTNKDADYIFEYHIKPMNLTFDRININGTDYSLNSYLNGDRNGVGTASNPIMVTRGSSVKLHADVKAACGEREQMDTLFNNAEKYVMQPSGAFTTASFESPAVNGKRYDQHGAYNECWLELKTQNGLVAGNTYAIVLNRFSGKGTEYYCPANIPDGTSRKGIIYFKMVN